MLFYFFIEVKINHMRVCSFFVYPLEQMNKVQFAGPLMHLLDMKVPQAIVSCRFNVGGVDQRFEHRHSREPDEDTRPVVQGKSRETL